ncbi:MAG: DUF4278 domain-containing protein [Leptolyngbyaceae cyanobacterium MO_188.B28]|nr:DUF4278 domain-containing protein [Leptolyngbyaceae cyanobacterium MO_188.B28]
MKLTYRGVNYDYTPNPVPKFGSVFATGTYRGAPVSFRALAEMPEQPSFDLKWRGVPYRSGPKVQKGGSPSVQAAAPETISPASATESEPGAPSTPELETTTPKLSVLERVRNLFMRRHRRIRQREQSMLARLNEEVGLTAEDAAHYESQIQGKIPHDFAGYDRSPTAMS